MTTHERADGRRPGRPRNADRARVNWIDVDRRLVYGEIHVHPDGTVALEWPSQRALSERYGVHHTTIGEWYRDHNCKDRRAKVRENHHDDELFELARVDGRIHTEASIQDVDGDTPGLQSYGIATVDQPDEAGLLPAAALPSAEIERILVHGEPIECNRGGWRIRFPTFAELAGRYQTSERTIAKLSQRGDCIARRKEAAELVRQGVDANMIALRVEAETEQQHRLLDIVDDYIRRFQEQLDAGAIAAVSVSDLDRLVKIRERVIESALARGSDDGLNLDDLQARYRQSRDAAALARNVTGEVGPEASTPATIDVEPERLSGTDG